MKTFTFLAGAMITISFFLSKISVSQCTADAGPDTVVCSDLLYSVIPVQIGGNPTASGGMEPYTYLWETFYSITIGTNTYYFFASDYLNDTTLANPTIIYGNTDTLIFHVTVIDAVNSICTDSVLVRFSVFGSTLEDKRRTIQQGDSVQLYSSIFGGIPPLSCHWEPDYNLSDPDSPNPWAKPDTTTAYINTITDSGGCQATDMDAFEVFVIPQDVAFHSQNNDAISIVPNPLTGQSTVQLNGSIQDAELNFFNINGQKVKTILPAVEQFTISKNDFTDGIYFYRLTGNGAQLATGKLIVR